MLKFWPSSIKNNKITQNELENEIELMVTQPGAEDSSELGATTEWVAIQAGINESNEFGVFHVIHHYFRDKYLADWNHHDFYYRATDFFQELMIRLENKKNSTFLSVRSVKYLAFYNELMSQELTYESIISYFNTLTAKARITMGKEKLFYQRYLVRVALPILMMSTGIIKKDFDQIVESIPSKMLRDEQRISIDRANGLFEFSSLFVILSKSTHPDAIDRFRQVASCILKNKSYSAFNLCAISMDVLGKISQGNGNFSHVSLSKYYMNIVVVILRKLLLSARQDRMLAINFLRKNLNSNRHLIADIFCSPFFWALLEEKSGRHSVSNTTEIFSLLRDAVFSDRSSDNPIELRKLIIESCLVDEVMYAPPLNIKKLSAEACAIFFALACHDYRSNRFFREDLKSVLQVCEDSSRTFDLEKVDLIKFLLKDSSLYRQNRLDKFCEQIQQDCVSEKEAHLICQYILIKQNLYGKDNCLSRCLVALQARYPELMTVSRSAPQDASRFFAEEATSNPVVVPVSRVLVSSQLAHWL